MNPQPQVIVLRNAAVRVAGSSDFRIPTSLRILRQSAPLL
jgi:hypothetical protein